MNEIPDDTPEHTVLAIETILAEEAVRLGTTCTRTLERKGLTQTLTLDVTLGSRSVRLFLSYIESHFLELVDGSIGNGFIVVGNTRWDLELLPGQLAPYAPPFRWGLYPPGHYDPLVEPSRLLDAQLLRQLLQ